MDEKQAELRNKLQAIKTLIELIEDGKIPSVNLIKLALESLEAIEKDLNN